MGPWVHGSMGVPMNPYGPMDPWTYGPMDPVHSGATWNCSSFPSGIVNVVMRTVSFE
jgi:hypothetical protein